VYSLTSTQRPVHARIRIGILVFHTEAENFSRASNDVLASPPPVLRGNRFAVPSLPFNPLVLGFEKQAMSYGLASGLNYYSS